MTLNCYKGRTRSADALSPDKRLNSRAHRVVDEVLGYTLEHLKGCQNPFAVFMHIGKVDLSLVAQEPWDLSTLGQLTRRFSNSCASFLIISSQAINQCLDRVELSSPG